MHSKVQLWAAYVLTPQYMPQYTALGPIKEPELFNLNNKNI